MAPAEASTSRHGQQQYNQVAAGSQPPKAPPKATALNALPVFPVDASPSASQPGDGVDDRNEKDPPPPQIVALGLETAAAELQPSVEGRAVSTPIKDRLRAVIGARMSTRAASTNKNKRKGSPSPERPRREPTAVAKQHHPDTRITRSSSEAAKAKAGTWEEYLKDYQSGKFNLENPPSPPTRPKSPSRPEEGEVPAMETDHMMPPRPSDERDRQRVVNWLETFNRGRGGHDAGAKTSRFRKGPTPSTSATASTSESSQAARQKAVADADIQEDSADDVSLASLVRSHAAPKAGAAKTSTALKGVTSASLEDYAPFRELVAQMRQEFDAQISLDDDKQVFLAETGLNGVAEDCPRDATICAHTILNDDRLFVVLDTQRDWRFKHNPNVNAFGSRFYAGMSIKAPALLGDVSGPRATFGTLCIADTVPRKVFTDLQRTKFASYADRASAELENWLRLQSRAKLGQMEQNYREWRIAADRRSAMRGARGASLGIGFLGAHRVSKHRGNVDDANGSGGLEVVVEVATPVVESPGRGPWGSPGPSTDSVTSNGLPAFADTHRTNGTPSVAEEVEGEMEDDSAMDRPVDTDAHHLPVDTDAHHFEDNRGAPIDGAEDDDGHSHHSSQPESDPDSEWTESAQRHNSQRRPSATSSTASNSLASVFNMATRMIGETLNMSFAYLVILDVVPISSDIGAISPAAIGPDHSPSLSSPPAGKVDIVKGMRLLSSWGLPVATSPTFDANVHLLALRCAERALVYQDETSLPSSPTMSAGTNVTKCKRVSDIVSVPADARNVPALGSILSDSDARGDGNVSEGREPSEMPSPAGGILVPVCELPPGPGEELGRGYVLCAFTDDDRRVIGLEDVVYIQAFADSLVEFVSQE